MKIYAHRGASQTFRENSIAAFSEALRLEVDGIELDIHATVDGIPVVTHDASLKRAFGIDQDVRQMSISALHDAAPDVPTFEQVLELVGDRAHLDIELKQGGIEQELLTLLAKYPSARWAISSFDWQNLRAIRALDDSCELWLLAMAYTDELATVAHELGATTAALYSPGISRNVVERVATAQLRTMAWTVNDPERKAVLAGWGVDSLCTDAPHLML